MFKKNILIITSIITIIILILGYWIYQNRSKIFIPENPGPDPKEQACLDSGGRVSTALCCKSVSDFPNTCLIGSCGCSLENSIQVKICECPENQCFNGEKCTVFNPGVGGGGSGTQEPIIVPGDQDNNGIASPASVNCGKKGGQVEIRTDTQGAQTGFCVFDDGSECEEWNLYKGDCKKGDKSCKDLCGDGVCQEIVCMALGCPCSESKTSCPKDCK